MERKKAFGYTLFYLFLIVLFRLVVFRRVLVNDFLILLGGVLGALGLDQESRLMAFLGHPADKPVLRNSLCQITLALLAFYIITSAVGLFPLGLVLGLLIRTLIEQYLGVQGVKNLGSWFWFLGREPGWRWQKFYFTTLGLFGFYLSLILVGR